MEEDAYSANWYATFLETIPEAQSQAEIELIEKYLPVAEFPLLLDIACGTGRHARLLAEAGYQVMGIDRDVDAISAARQRGSTGPRVTYETMDMRHVGRLEHQFDGAVNLWHSFGYYDEATNLGIVRDLAGRLRDGGRVLFDLYNRDHMSNLPDKEIGERNGVAILTSRSWEGNRMRCEIEYPTLAESGDVLSWYTYAPYEFANMVSACGFTEVLRCAWFDESVAVSAEHARMQFVFEKH